MSDTPETYNAISSAIRIYGDNGVPVTLCDHARKMEAERDEARNAIREAWLVFDDLDDDRADEWQNKWAAILWPNTPPENGRREP